MSELAVCPACGKHGISVGARSYYSRGWPAKCRECGTLAYDRPHGRAAAFGCLLGLFRELMIFPILAACIFFPWAVVIGGILILIPAVIFYRRYRRRRPEPATRFRSITPEESHRAYLRAFAAYIAVLVGVVVVLIWAAHAQ